MSRKKTIALSLIAVAILVGTAMAFSNISLVLGTIPSYDFGNKFGGAQPATIQFHTFTMKPGDTVPWHYHKALSYVVLERGTLTEAHVDSKFGSVCFRGVSRGKCLRRGSRRGAYSQQYG